MKTILTGWHFMRVIRLALGLLIIWQAYLNMDWMAGIIGLALMLLAVTNTGCCSANGCQVRVNRTGQKMDSGEEKIKYEEVG